MLTNREFTQQIIDHIPNPLIITDTVKLRMCNKYFLEFFDYKSPDDFLKEHNCVCELFEDKEGYFSLNSIDKNTLWTDYLYKLNKQVKVSIIDKQNKPNIFDLKVDKLEDNYIVVFTNITAQENESALYKLAYYDPLTKIYNRQMFDKLYLRELKNKKRYGDPLSLIMLDIDHFKEVNDIYGHDIGDKVLIALTELISKNIRENDIFARWGGEEFMLLLPRTKVEEAYKKAQELRELLDAHAHIIPHFTASFGVTEIQPYDKELSAFIRVDKALYKAKEKRNDVIQL